MENTIQSDLIRGHINTIILKALFDGDRYGYDIVREIEQKSSGQYKLKQPTLYSCLKRLEIQGFIRSYWGAKSNGGRRKYFTLTDMGRELFIKNQHEWEYSRTVIDKLISDREVDLSSARPLYDDESADASGELDEEQIDESEFNEDAGEEEAEEKTAEPLEEPVCEETRQESASESDTEEKAPEPEKREISFSDTTAIMNELLGKNSETGNNSYTAKLVSEKYVSDRTDSGISSGDYFKDFYDASEAFSDKSFESNAEADETQAYTPAEPEKPIYQQPQFEQTAWQSAAATAPEPEPEPQQSSLQNIFLDYHSTPLVHKYDESAIIEREYKNILGNFLNPCFVDKRAAAQPEQEYAEEPEQIQEEPQEETYDNYEAEQEESAAADETEQSEEVAEQEFESYTSDADVNRKLNRITGEVREMGDNVRIRTHSNKSAKEYNNTYYYYSNKLMLVHYGILFAVMLLEIIFSAVLVKAVLGAGASRDVWFYVLAVVVALAFPVAAFAKNFTAPDKQKRINFNLKNSLIYRIIVMAQCFLIIYCLNIIGGMPLGFSSEYLTTVLMPALLCTNFPVSALIFNALFKTKKFAVRQ